MTQEEWENQYNIQGKQPKDFRGNPKACGLWFGLSPNQRAQVHRMLEDVEPVVVEPKDY